MAVAARACGRSRCAPSRRNCRTRGHREPLCQRRPDQVPEAETGSRSSPASAGFPTSSSASTTSTARNSRRRRPGASPGPRRCSRRGVFGTFWFEDAGPLALLDRIGADNVLWETDFPHPRPPLPVAGGALGGEAEGPGSRCDPQDHAGQTPPSCTRSRSNQHHMTPSATPLPACRRRRDRAHGPGELPGQSVEEIAVGRGRARPGRRGLTVSDLDGLIACKSVQGQGNVRRRGSTARRHLPYVQALDYGTCNFSLHLAVMGRG